MNTFLTEVSTAPQQKIPLWSCVQNSKLGRKDILKGPSLPIVKKTWQTGSMWLLRKSL